MDVEEAPAQRSMKDDMQEEQTIAIEVLSCCD